MPSKPESGLYQRLKENLPACHITRIESRVNLGIPDCLVAFKVPGEFVMVELKVVRRGRKVVLSPHQVSFHAKHADMNCPTYILVQYFPPGATRTSHSELRLYAGEQAVELSMRGIDTVPLAAWPWTQIPWELVRLHMLDAAD